MEEILASIRRIIESNEPTGESMLSQSLPPVYSDDELDEIEDIGFAPELAANDPGVAPHGSQPLSYPIESSANSSTGERAVSLADVAARVRAASGRQQESFPARPVVFPSLAAAAPGQLELAPTASPAPVSDQAPARVPQMEEARSAFTPVSSLQPVVSEPPAFSAAPDMPTTVQAYDEPAPRVEPAPAMDAEPASLPTKIEEAATLLSAEAGAQVAKSFNELAAVFNGLEHRSVEEMAQEMLRPMLQEWLDDNLPTLVERLVREEIERVARGPRR
jgi:cell pole-organizing protein PopZ